MIRKYIMVVTVAVIAIGTVAFKAMDKNVNETRYHYLNNDDTDIDKVGSWEEIVSTEPTNCDNFKQLPCVISIASPLSDFLEENDTLAKIMAQTSVLESTKSVGSN